MVAKISEKHSFLKLRYFLFILPIFLIFLFLQLIFITTIYASWSPKIAQSNVESKHEIKDRVAICLAGGLRRFELTAPTLETHLFSAYENSDVFVVAPLDSNAFKLWTVSNSNIVAVQFVKQIQFPEDEILENVVNFMASSTGRQGLMQYSALVEGCVYLIEEYEIKHGFKYDWVLRTRPDGLWSEPPPPLSSLSSHALYIPKGSEWTGLNDRLSLGSRDLVMKTLEWVSSLPMIYREKKINLIAEIKYLELINSLNLTDAIAPSNFSFCVLTEKKFGWPLAWQQSPYYSASVSPIDAPEDGGGRYCRPCIPLKENWPVSNETAFEWYHTTTFCNGSDSAFAPDWKRLYDDFFDSKISHKRVFYEKHDNFWSCVRNLERLFVKIDTWLGEQDMYVVCSLHYNPKRERG